MNDSDSVEASINEGASPKQARHDLEHTATGLPLHSGIGAADAESTGIGAAAQPPIVQAIHAAFARWTRQDPPALESLGEQDATAPVDVVNRYKVTFGRALSGGVGKGSGRTAVYSQEDLARHVENDVAAMTGGLVDTVSRATGTETRALYPELPPHAVANTGVSAVHACVCAACAGTTSVTCPSCTGTLQCKCHQCIGGKTRCATCSGSGQVTTTCYSCGGTGGSYSAAATWDYQYQQDTWDYQRRQTATGGQWQACTACGGSRGSKTTCTACSYGQVSCAHCLGRGFNDCTQCNRSGKVACVKCAGGYVHTRYEPQVEIAHTHELVAGADASDIQRRVFALTRARLDELGEPAGPPTFSRDEHTVVRTHRWDIPAAIHVLRSGDKERRLLSVRQAGQVLDFDGIGDDALGDGLAAFEQATRAGNAKAATRGFHDVPIHASAATRLAASIGLKSLVPMYAPSPAALDAKFLAGTAHFVSRAYAGRYVAAMATALRGALLRTHGIGALSFLVALVALAAATRFGAPTTWLALSGKWLWGAAFAIMAVAEAWLWLRYPFGRVAHGLLAKNALHWVLLAAYPALALLFQRAVAPWLVAAA